MISKVKQLEYHAIQISFTKEILNIIVVLIFVLIAGCAVSPRSSKETLKIPIEQTATFREMWNRAQRDDKAAMYELFLKKYPISYVTQEATERLHYLKKNGAKPEIEYPTLVESVRKPDGTYWRLKAILVETGGKMGFRISNRYIELHYLNGQNYNSTWHKYYIAKIEKGKKEEISYDLKETCGRCGGDVDLELGGDDENGNRFKFTINYRLKCNSNPCSTMN